MVAMKRQAASVSSPLVSSPLGWRPLALKGLVATAVLLPLSVLAQAPTPAPAPAPEAAAGAYKALTPHPSLAGTSIDARKTLSKTKALIRSVLSGEASLRDNQVVFNAFYQRYYFPLMTQTTAAALKDLPEERMRFVRDHLEYSAKSNEAHSNLIALTLNEMTNIVRDNYHPGVRYNAMLVISSLNDVEPIRVGGNPTLPVPMARALPIILAEFKRPENSDAVKLAALLGLARHLEWENYKEGAPPMEAGLRAEILKELVALAEAKELPEGRMPEGHLWMRRRAVEALGLATVKRADANIAAKLDTLLRDEAEPVALRCAAAAALGQTSLQSLAVDVPATAKELGYLAMVICDSELTRVDNLKKIEQDRKAKLVSQGGYGSDASGYSGEDMYGSGGYPAESGYPSAGGASGGATGPRGPRPAAGASGGYGSEYGSGYPGDYGSGMSGSMGSAAVRPLDPKAYRFDYVRRRMRAQLYCVQLALTGGEDYDPSKTPAAGAPPAESPFKTGLAAIAKAGDKPTLDKIYGSVRKLSSTIETADPDVADMAKLDESLRKEIRTLEGLTRKLNAAPVVAPAATSDAPAGDLPTIPGPPATPAPGGEAAPRGKAAPGKAAPGKAAPPAVPSPTPPANAAAAR